MVLTLPECLSAASPATKVMRLAYQLRLTLLQVPQRRPGGFAAGVAADHAAALLPAALALDLVGGRAVLGHAAGHADAPAVAAEELPVNARPAALAIAFTRRAIWDSESPNTFASPPTPTGRMASRAFMATGVMATTAPWASASVLERMTVMRPLPSSQRCTSPQVRVRSFGAA